MDEIPDDHPRAQSLRIRHEIIDGMHKKIVAEAGLIAHGRGEAYDYLLGEKTHQFAKTAIKAAAAMLKLAQHPIISVNGNVAALCPDELIKFSKTTNIPIEINLFYRSEERIEAIKNHLETHESGMVLGVDPIFYDQIEELSSQRRIVDKRGIKVADVVLVPLEDGDRTEALKKNGKNVITIDLNPLSRTANQADITIVDNVIRVFDQLLNEFNQIKSESEASKILEKYDNRSILLEAMRTITTEFSSKI